jgi:hypothetical protein
MRYILAVLVVTALGGTGCSTSTSGGPSDTSAEGIAEVGAPDVDIPGGDIVPPLDTADLPHEEPWSPPPGAPPPAEHLGEQVGVWMTHDLVTETGGVLQPISMVLFPGLEMDGGSPDQPGLGLQIEETGVIREQTGGDAPCERIFVLVSMDEVHPSGVLDYVKGIGDCGPDVTEATISFGSEGTFIRMYYDEPADPQDLDYDGDLEEELRWRRQVLFQPEGAIVATNRTVTVQLHNTTDDALFVPSCYSWFSVVDDEPPGGLAFTGGSCAGGAPDYDSCNGIGEDFAYCGHYDCLGGQNEIGGHETASKSWSGKDMQDIEGAGCCERSGPPHPAGEYFAVVHYEQDGECHWRAKAFTYPTTEPIEFLVQ